MSISVRALPVVTLLIGFSFLLGAVARIAKNPKKPLYRHSGGFAADIHLFLSWMAVILASFGETTPFQAFQQAAGISSADVLSYRSVCHESRAGAVDTHESDTIERKAKSGNFFGAGFVGEAFRKGRGSEEKGRHTMNSQTIEKDAVVTILRSIKPRFQQSYGLRRIGLFGSVARGGGQGPASDVEVVVDLERQDLFSLIGIKQELEETLRAEVDLLSYRQTMNPYLKRHIDAEAI
jgi:predicted nucleotidyltransferase